MIQLFSSGYIVGILFQILEEMSVPPMFTEALFTIGKIQKQPKCEFDPWLGN